MSFSIGYSVCDHHPLPSPSVFPPFPSATIPSLKPLLTVSFLILLPSLPFLPAPHSFPLTHCTSLALLSLPSPPLPSLPSLTQPSPFLTQSVTHCPSLSPPLPPQHYSGQTYQVSLHSNPETDTITMLTNVTLNCRIQPLPSTYHYFEWTATNGYYSSRYTNHSTVFIPWFRPENEGVYTCAVYLGNGALLQSGTRTLSAQGYYAINCYWG